MTETATLAPRIVFTPHILPHREPAVPRHQSVRNDAGSPSSASLDAVTDWIRIAGSAAFLPNATPEDFNAPVEGTTLGRLVGDYALSCPV